MILRFDEYINESYLKGGRHLLYHYTQNFGDILKTDMLKISKAVDGENSISFTRSPYYKEHSSPFRFVLDSDLLKRDGYKIIPYDEAGKMISSDSSLRNNKKFKSYSKANPYFSGRYVRNNVGIEDEISGGFGGLEWEYEERSFKDIHNLGKYLIGIDVNESRLYNEINKIKAYVDKYPHIEVTILKPSLYDRRNIVDIDKLFSDKQLSKKKDIKEYIK